MNLQSKCAGRPEAARAAVRKAESSHAQPFGGPEKLKMPCRPKACVPRRSGVPSSRSSVMGFKKGEPVLILEDPSGTSWLMQAWSMIGRSEPGSYAGLQVSQGMGRQKPARTILAQTRRMPRYPSMSPNQAENTLAIVKITNPVVDGADLIYSYSLIDGTMPASGGATSLFIDSIGVGGGGWPRLPRRRRRRPRSRCPLAELSGSHAPKAGPRIRGDPKK